MLKVKLIIFLILLVTLGACSFKSSQYNFTKSTILSFNKPEVSVNVEDAFWKTTIAGRELELLPVVFEQGVRFVSRGGTEIDFDKSLFSVVAVRGWESIGNDVIIRIIDDVPGSGRPNFMKKHQTKKGKTLKVTCTPYAPSSKRLYTRNCIENAWKWWEYEDKIYLNDAGEVSKIEAGVWINSEPLILTWVGHKE